MMAEHEDTTAGERPSASRFTCHLPPELAEKIRDLAWWERRTVAEVVTAALSQFVERMERERGEAYEPRGGALRRGRPL